MDIPKMMQFFALICLLLVTRVDMGHKDSESEKKPGNSKTTKHHHSDEEEAKIGPELEEWESHKSRHKKNYSPEEEKKRKLAYHDSLNTIQKHNDRHSRGKEKYRLGSNEYADMPPEEFSSTLAGEMGVTRVRGIERGHQVHQVNDTAEIENMPLEVDWRTKGYVTDVKNQGRCGSCYAFAAVAVMEGQLYNLTGNLVTLSEQNVIDCSSGFGNIGCSGGATLYAYKYAMAAGLNSQNTYPYAGKTQSSCQYNANDKAVSVGKYVTIKANNETLFQHAVATVGPIAVAVNSDLRSFQLYKSGIYDDPNCSTKVNHAVVIVGYGTDNGTDYWLIKNSWGKSWGDHGYMYLFRNNNTCGVASSGSYVVLQ